MVTLRDVVEDLAYVESHVDSGVEGVVLAAELHQIRNNVRGLVSRLEGR
jgi:hypothetical protein